MPRRKKYIWRNPKTNISYYKRKYTCNNIGCPKGTRHEIYASNQAEWESKKAEDLANRFAHLPLADRLSLELEEMKNTHYDKWSSSTSVEHRKYYKLKDIYPEYKGWLRDNRKPNTLKQYSDYFERFFFPKFKNYVINEIKPEQLIIFFDSFIKKRKPDCINAMQSCLYSFFKWSRQRGFITSTPMNQDVKDVINDARHNHKKANPKKLIEIDIKASIWLFQKLRETRSDDLFYPLLFCRDAGLRISEATGLAYEDFDALKTMIHVQRQTFYQGGKHFDEKGLTFQSLKSTQSDRWVHVSLEMYQFLEQIGHNIDTGKVPADEFGRHPLFLLPRAKTNDYSEALRNRFKNWLNKQEKQGQILPDDISKIHNLRHTFASVLFDKNINMYEVQKLLGHSDVSITLGTYGHSIKDANKRIDFTTLIGGQDDLIRH